MGEIARAAVIGAGTMGSGIASHLANAGTPVVLLDVAAEGAHRSAIAGGAVERMLRTSPPPFVHPDRAGLIRAGNIEDHLDWLAECDSIAEAVVERLDVKQDLYRRVNAVRRPGSMISSNTSTIPLARLTEGMPDDFRADFCITHFFNPVRYMRLLELVAGPDTRPEVVSALAGFCDVALGKGVVPCRDTPGFLANRVGVFALQAGMVEAAAHGLTVEEADALMGRPMGIPKTGVFGLYDLIGLDLMLDVVAFLREALPAGDAFHEVADGIPAVARLVADGRAGRKSGAGFYRTAKVDGEPRREAVDLDALGYRPATRPALEAAAAGERAGLRALVESPDRHGRYARRVLARVLSYAASLVPEVADDPVPVDEAMKLGYGWARGPFEMIDALGPAWFRECLREEGLPVPAYLESVADATFYRADSDRLERRDFAGDYATVARAPGVIRLGDLTRTRRPLARTDAASLWDVGDGVACAEFHSKANALRPDSMALLDQAVALLAGGDWRGLVIHNDAPHFSVGVDLGFVLAAARDRDWAGVDEMLIGFQGACRSLKYAPFPVIGAPAGMALGGGFEVLLHCDAVQCHVNTVTGLVEPLVGVVPGGGGCKEMLARWQAQGKDALAGALAAATQIGVARTAASPDEAAPLLLLRDVDRSTMNRDRLLAEAKARAIEMAEGYAPPAAPAFEALGDAGRAAIEAEFARLHAEGTLAPHDLVVGRALARVMSGGDAAAGAAVSEDDLYALEREVFIELLQTPETVARIEHMLGRGRPLRN